MALDSSVHVDHTPLAPAATHDLRNVGRLLISCADRPGIVSAVSGFLAKHGANIIESQQYTTDPTGGRFFLRVEFVLSGLLEALADLEAGLAELAAPFDMDWRVHLASRTKRLGIMVSKTDHVLQELLWRRQAGDLRAEIAVVVSNHADLADSVRGWGVPFVHVPVEKGSAAGKTGHSGKELAERRQLQLLREAGVDTLVLARYMQVLSAGFLEDFGGQAINIHHSFLPAFVGANPYARAAERGVKLIGATAHYVTAELDAGPIIEQDVCRVDHRHTVEDLRRAGRYVERSVLARAVSWHVEDRVIVHGNKTIVFA